MIRINSTWTDLNKTSECSTVKSNEVQNRQLVVAKRTSIGEKRKKKRKKNDYLTILIFQLGKWNELPILTLQDIYDLEDSQSKATDNPVVSHTRHILVLLHDKRFCLAFITRNLITYHLSMTCFCNRVYVKISCLNHSIKSYVAQTFRGLILRTRPRII